jgi:hypothetical protein
MQPVLYETEVTKWTVHLWLSLGSDKEGVPETHADKDVIMCSWLGIA